MNEDIGAYTDYPNGYSSTPLLEVTPCTPEVIACAHFSISRSRDDRCAVFLILHLAFEIHHGLITHATKISKKSQFESDPAEKVSLREERK
jgi:hypothetical protein